MTTTSSSTSLSATRFENEHAILGPAEDHGFIFHDNAWSALKTSGDWVKVLYFTDMFNTLDVIISEAASNARECSRPNFHLLGADQVL